MDALSDMRALNQKAGEGSENQSEPSGGRVVGKGTPLPAELGGRACADPGAPAVTQRARPAPSGACATAGPAGPERGLGALTARVWGINSEGLGQ